MVILQEMIKKQKVLLKLPGYILHPLLQSRSYATVVWGLPHSRLSRAICNDNILKSVSLMMCTYIMQKL